jgi:hypothetical protein
MFQFSNLANPISVTLKLIRQLKVKVTESTVRTQVESHPEYPSLLALSDCLTEWGIINQAYQIDKATYDPADLEFPFIAHFAASGGSYILVHQIENGKVTYSDEKVDHASMPEVDFLAKWSGVALHGVVNETNGEPNYQQKKVAEWFNAAKPPLFIIAVIGIILRSLDHGDLSLSYVLLFAVKLVGLATSVLLLVHSIDVNNPLVQNLCSLGNKNNCNAILKSTAAQVTSWLSWSEVGFFYFLGSATALLLAPPTLPLLAWLNVLALPYIAYSLTYQYRQKSWCVLCCTIQAVLGLEFIINISSPTAFSLQNVEYNFSLISTLLLSFTLPVLAWYLLKPMLLQSALVKPLKSQLKKFKYNSDLFNQLLTTQPKYGVSDELMPIVLGNPTAEHVITMVSNPFCGPCATAHQELDEWLKYRDDIQLKIIFTTADHDDDERTKVSRHMSALSLLQDATLVERALNDWYKLSSKKYETWAAKYPISFNGEMSKVTAKQKEWCNLTEIEFTPTILLNGYKLPAPYRLEDIKYLIT